VYLRQHKHEEALADFNQAIRLKPKDALSYCHCGTIFFLSKDFATALRCYKDAHKLNSSLPEPQAGIAITLHAIGKLPQAKRAWQSVVKKTAYYQNPEWLKNELKWAEPLVDEARKLIGELDN
jgi:tetratricopeptide (TPR) repeat protein